jgi:hypothetical protein
LAYSIVVDGILLLLLLLHTLFHTHRLLLLPWLRLMQPPQPPWQQ